jgi:hypothetical protein
LGLFFPSGAPHAEFACGILGSHKKGQPSPVALSPQKNGCHPEERLSPNRPAIEGRDKGPQPTRLASPHRAKRKIRVPHPRFVRVGLGFVFFRRMAHMPALHVGSWVQQKDSTSPGLSPQKNRCHPEERLSPNRPAIGRRDEGPQPTRLASPHRAKRKIRVPHPRFCEGGSWVRHSSLPHHATLFFLIAALWRLIASSWLPNA